MSRTEILDRIYRLPRVDNDGLNIVSDRFVGGRFVFPLRAGDFFKRDHVGKLADFLGIDRLDLLTTGGAPLFVVCLDLVVNLRGGVRENAGHLGKLLDDRRNLRRVFPLNFDPQVRRGLCQLPQHGAIGFCVFDGVRIDDKPAVNRRDFACARFERFVVRDALFGVVNDDFDFFHVILLFICFLYSRR